MPFDPKTVVVVKSKDGVELARCNAANRNRLHQLMVEFSGRYGPLKIETEDDPLLSMLNGMFG